MPLKKQYQVFVDEMVKHGDQQKAYSVAFKTTSKDAIYKGCLRMSKNVDIQSAIKTESDKIKTTATQQAITELKEQIKGNILTRQKKLEILNQIATGQLKIPIKKPVWDSIQKKYVLIPMEELPDHGAVLKAIEIENRMTGDNAADKWEGEVKTPIIVESKDDGLDYDKMPIELKKQILAYVRKK